MILPGGIDTSTLTSLNGLGLLADQSGHYVDPLRWREGIHGLTTLGDLGDAVPLTPGLHGLMEFPGSGGADVLVRNPIHPDSPSSGLRFTGGARNQLADSMHAGHPSACGGTSAAPVDTSGVTASEQLLGGALTLHSGLAVLGLAGLGCADCGGACGGRGGLGALGTTDFSFSGQLIPGVPVPNWVLYGAAALLLLKGGR